VERTGRAAPGEGYGMCADVRAGLDHRHARAHDLIEKPALSRTELTVHFQRTGDVLIALERQHWAVAREVGPGVFQTSTSVQAREPNPERGRKVNVSQDPPARGCRRRGPDLG